LHRALQSAGVDAKPQVTFGRYRLDFLLEHEGRRLAIEADGRDYHDPERDAVRDRKLREAGIEEVLRFTGSEIWLDAAACAGRVVDYLGRGQRAHRNARRQALDDSQLKAVAHGSGAAHVLAPAGAGKTRVLVNRVAALPDRGVEPSSILALTFNKKTNDQLIERLEDLGIPISPTKLFDPENEGVVCATFNAFGFRYQRELLSLNHPVGTSQLVWRDMMARAVRGSGASLRGATRGSDPVGEFLRALERVRTDLQNPQEVEVELDTFNGAAPVVPFAPVYAAYQRLRLDAGVQAFGDQLHIAVLDLLGSPGNREFVQGRFRHVLVDEYQDLNATQLALVNIVSRPWRNLYAVGDDDQLIYGWRFADLTNILAFHDRVPPTPHSATYVLSTNYRSSRAIVEASRRVIDHNQQREKKQIQPALDAAEGEVRYVRSASWQERSEEIVRFLKEQKTPRSQWRDLAVLCRVKAQQPFIALTLDRAGIPRTPLLTYRLFSDRHVQLLRSYLQLVRNPKGIDGDALRLLLNRPDRRLTNEFVEQLAAAPHPWTLMTATLDDPACPHGLKNLCARVTTLNGQWMRTRPTSARMLQDVLVAFDLESYWRDERHPQGLRDQDDADPVNLLRLIRLHSAEISAPAVFLEFWDAGAQRENEQFDTAPDDLAREANPNTDQVVISTIHSSKGREYDGVVLYDYDADLEKLSAREVEEERRVFYVGLTRARHSALITLDANSDRLPQFVRESIAPRRPQEELEIKARRRELRDAEGDAVVAAAKLQKQLDSIASGDELARSAVLLKCATAAVAAAITELATLTSLLDHPTMWARLRGHVARARREAAVLEDDLATRRRERDALDRRVAVLETEPAIVAAPIQEELQRKHDELDAARAGQARLRSRLRLLELLGGRPHAEHGGVMRPRLSPRVASASHLAIAASAETLSDAGWDEVAASVSGDY
jgi:ATP-dependent DNA helicase UvrD/PcrA